MPKVKAKAIIPEILPQGVQPFKPTPHMIVWLDTAIELATDSPAKVSAVNQQRRENWYYWVKLDGFEDWFYEAYKKKRRRWLPKLDEIGMIKSKDDFKYWEAMNKKAGDLEEKQETNVQVNILSAIQEQKKKYGFSS